MDGSGDLNPTLGLLTTLQCVSGDRVALVPWRAYRGFHHRHSAAGDILGRSRDAKRKVLFNEKFFGEDRACSTS